MSIVTHEENPTEKKRRALSLTDEAHAKAMQLKREMHRSSLTNVVEALIQEEWDRRHPGEPAPRSFPAEATAGK